MKAKISIISFMLFAFVLFGHSGNTDSKGGHYNRKTGKYHYHHGMPAHSHPFGICSNLIYYGVAGIGALGFMLWINKEDKNNHKK